MLWYSYSNRDEPISQEDKRAAVAAVCSRYERLNTVLIVPPDITRAHSGAGELTCMLVKHITAIEPDAHIDILPALGTHFPMTADERAEMFGDLPGHMFREHNWREGLAHLGEIPASFIAGVSGGKLDYPVTVEINELIVKGGYDAVISIGQVVPHEVVGMANGNKNILVGTGGRDMINKTHFLGAVCNMETILGTIDNPVREVFNYAEEAFLAGIPLCYIQTVIAGDKTMRGIYAGPGKEPFRTAAALSQQLNITKVNKPLNTVVVFLDPREFKSTWLGNKAIYRTRMAIADGGELIIHAPGVETFGEDREIDRLIRQYGYRGTTATRAAVKDNEDLASNLSAAAHLIHGSSEGRFSITYAPGKLTREEVEGVNFRYAGIEDVLQKYGPELLRTGYNTIKGEEIYYISNPALGLWMAEPSRGA
jgi:nickel-dependent lactate racemase